MRYAMICYDIHYDYSSHNDTNFTVRRFLEKNNESVNGKLVPTCRHSMSKIVVKLFVLNRFYCNILKIFFLQFYSQETLGVRGQPRQYKRGWSHCFASGKLTLTLL